MADGKMRRNIQFHFFATREEAEKIQKRMEEIGVRNRCAYLRKMAIDGYYICVELSDVKEMVRLLRIYGNNLNQLARRANEDGNIYRKDIEDLQKNMQELWKMMRQILEKLSCLE
ncbi:MAG: plasmid mobilization protein [Eubacterium sp.]